MNEHTVSVCRMGCNGQAVSTPLRTMKKLRIELRRSPASAMRSVVHGAGPDPIRGLLSWLLTGMKAVTLREYGDAGNLRLEDVDVPEPSKGELRIAVHASAVNPADWLVMRGPIFLRLGTGLRRPKHPIPGMDVAGVVDAVGRDVTGFAVGDEVYGELGRGAFAERVCTSPGLVARKPDRLTFEEAAASPLAGLTALHALRDVGSVQPGHHVLIIGASGGVGTFAVQIAKAMGAEVTGVCSTSNVELVRSIGADHVVDYTHDDVTATAARFDLILDNAASHTLRQMRKVLTPTGILIPNSANGGVKRMLWAAILWKVGRRPLRIFISKSSTADLDTLRELLDSGAVTPVIDRTYPLAETPDAVAYAARGHARGKVVIRCRSG